MPALAAPLLTESALGSLSAACGCAVASSGTVRSLCRRERPATPPSPPSDPHPTPPRFALSWSPSLSRQTRLVSERLGAVSASSPASFCLPVSHRRDAHAGALAAAASPLGFGGLFARRARLTRRHDRHESCSAQAFPRRGWHLLPLSSTASSLSSSVAALLHWSRFRPASRFAAPTSLFAAASLDMLPAGLQRDLTAREGLSGAAEASPGFAFALTQRRAFGSRRAKTVKQISYRALRRAINEFKQSELREHPREAASAFLIPAASSRLLPGEGATKALSDRPRLADSASLPLRPPSAADLRSSYADPLKYSTSLVPAPLPSPPPVLFQRTVTLPASPEKDLQLRARRLPLGNVKKLKSFELTAALCTYAQVYVHHAALWTALVKECDGRSEQFSPSEACWVLHAFAQAKARREKTSGAPRHAGADSAPDGASLRRASSRLCTHIARHFRFLSLPDAARALHAVSVLQLPDVRLFRLLWPLLPELLEEFRSQHLAADSSPQRAHRVLQLLVAALAHENAPHADVLRAAGDVYTSHINRWVDAQLQRMRQEKKRLRRRSRALAGSRSGGAVGATEGAQVEPGPGDADDKETSVIFRLSDLGDKSPLEQTQHKGAGASASEQDVDALLPMPRRLAAVLEAFARLQYRHEPLIAATLRLFQLSSASQPRPSTPVSAASDGAAAARPLQPSSALFQRGLEAAATAPSLQRPEDSFCPDRGAHVHPGGIGAPEALSSVSLNPYPALPAGVPPYRRSESRGGRERDGGGNCLPLTSSLSLGSLSSSVSQPTCLLAPSSPRGAAPTSASVLVPRVGSSAFPPVSVDSSQSRALSRRRTGVSLPWTGEAAVARALCLSPRALMRRKRDEGRNPASVSASPLSLQLKRFGFAGSPWQLPLGERHKRHALAGKLRKRVDWRRMLHETLASNVLPGRRSPFLSSKLERSKTKSAVIMQQIEARRAESAALAFRQRQKPWVAADLGTALVALEALGVKSLGLVQLWKHEVYANLHRLSHSETLDALETARRVGWYSRAFGQRAFARVAWCLKPERGGIRDANELVRAGLLLADWSNSDKEMQEVTRTVKKKMAAIGRQWLMEEEGEDALREVCRHLERLGHIPPPSASLQLSRSLAHSPATAASSHLRLSASGAGPLSTGAALPAVSQLTSPRDAASSARSDSADASAFLSSADALSSSGVCRGPSHLLPQSAQRPARAGSWPCPRRLPLRGLAGIFPWRPIEAISSEAVAPAHFPALLHITVSLFPTSPPIPLELLLPRIRQCAVGAAVSLNTVHDMLRDLNALQQFRAVAHRSPARVCRPNWVHSGVSSVASLARRAPASTFFSPAAAASPSSFISPCSSPRGPGYSSTASLACAKEAEPRAGIPRDGQDPREAILDRTEAALWRVARQRVRRAVAAVSENGMSGGAAGSDAPDAGEALASPSLQAGVPREEKRAVGLDALRQTDVTLEALARHGAMLISLKNAAVEASAFQPRQSCQPDAGERDTCSPATASGTGAPGALAPSSPGNVERKSPQAPVSSPEREMQQGCGEKGSWQEGRPARCVEGAARAEREAESVAVLNAVRRSIRMPPALRNTSQGGQDAARHSGANEPRLGEGWTPQNVKEAVAVLSLEAAPYTAGLLRPEPCLSRRVCRTPRNLEQNPSNSTSCRNCGHDAQGGPDEFDRHDVMPVSPRRRALPPACACLGAGPAEEGSCRQPWQPARKSAERAAPNRGQPSPSGDGRGDASKEDPPPSRAAYSGSQRRTSF
ncbi:hypothetical protein BESB_062210 [Besnoitia besnoiti]|uniref:Uncharacterized protein n=1 Tax=Besnoitia besnoiti TaxID=94643 RepID=A0A2A9MDR5_BESBE|nr:hypothetical protein BESB_062210 [Besnoitia besnoiti]PFH35334.1 hypothetical protein BESB_062210 [Besnoitia besnoiti]